jgi:uncharacterized membrane protein
LSKASSTTNACRRQTRKSAIAETDAHAEKSKTSGVPFFDVFDAFSSDGSSGFSISHAEDSMNRRLSSILVFGMLLAVVGAWCMAEVDPGQAKVIADIERLGGKVTVDETDPANVAISVRLNHAEVTGPLLQDLKRLTNLRDLDLAWTNVTDGMLGDLQGLTRLLSLDISDTKVTGAGLSGQFQK